MGKIMQFLLASSSMILVFCTPSNKTSADQIVYREKSEEFQRCVEGACAEIALSYPIFEGEPLLAEQLNEHVNQLLVGYIKVGDQKPNNLKGAIRDFFVAYLQNRQESNVADQPWELEISGKVTYQTKHLLGLRFSSYSFLGGAHPNTHESHLTIDLDSGGTILGQKDMVLNKDKLLALAQKKFRDFHQVEPAASLEEDGRFFLKNEGFFLPQSMGYEQNNFVLFYNNYEIGSYAMGSTELRFSLDELEGIVLLK
jgi:hypothetical protein